MWNSGVVEELSVHVLTRLFLCFWKFKRRSDGRLHDPNMEKKLRFSLIDCMTFIWLIMICWRDPLKPLLPITTTFLAVFATSALLFDNGDGDDVTLFEIAEISRISTLKFNFSSSSLKITECHLSSSKFSPRFPSNIPVIEILNYHQWRIFSRFDQNTAKIHQVLCKFMCMSFTKDVTMYWIIVIECLATCSCITTTSVVISS